MNNLKSFKWLGIFAHTFLLISIFCFSVHLLHYKDVGGANLTTYKYNEYVEKISSLDNVNKLRELCVLRLKYEEEQFRVFREYMSTLLWASIGIFVLALLAYLAQLTTVKNRR